MATLDTNTIAHLLQPYIDGFPVPASLFSQLSTYLDLLLKWNARTNLTAIREPHEIVQRHFGESLFAGKHLSPDAKMLLDFGSGAGFPGLPMQLLRPELSVTLAESQGKKASFLREVIRTLGMPTEVWSHRVEAMPADRQFDVVTLRAVDRMTAALEAAKLRVYPGGTLVVLSSEAAGIPVPGSKSSVLQLLKV